jgi:putative transposase
MVRAARAAALKIGRYDVRRVMRAEGLRAIQPKGFTPRTTESRHAAKISPNLMKD